MSDQTDDGWRPIESCPDDCILPILVFCPGANRGLDSCEVVTVCKQDGGILDYWTNGGPNGGDDLYFEPGHEPTHWQHLPPAPRGFSYT